MDIPVRYLPENYSMRDTLQDNPSAGRRSKRFFSTRFSASFCQPPLPPTNDKKNAKKELRYQLPAESAVRTLLTPKFKIDPTRSTVLIFALLIPEKFFLLRFSKGQIMSDGYSIRVCACSFRCKSQNCDRTSVAFSVASAECSLEMFARNVRTNFTSTSHSLANSHCEQEMSNCTLSNRAIRSALPYKYFTSHFYKRRTLGALFV